MTDLHQQRDDQNPAGPTLRPVTHDDDRFLFELYASTRRDELAAIGWGEPQQNAFLRMQFDAQQRAYAFQFPQADHSVILLGDEPIGGLLVVRSADGIRLVDITLFPTMRNRGIGTTLIQDLLNDATGAGLSVHLQVMKDNPAALLYQRLGFFKIGETGSHIQMERTPTKNGALATGAEARP